MACESNLAGRITAWAGLLVAGAAVALAAADHPGKDLGVREVSVYNECDEFDDQGERLLPRCNETCVQKVWAWRFWVTNYNVDESLGLGEHQGIGIFGFEYTVDPRFPPAANEPRAWAAPSNLRERVTEPPAVVSKTTLCGAPRLVNQKMIYNHGRTLAGTTSGDWNEDIATLGIPVEVPPEGEIVVGPLRRDELSNPESESARRVERIRACVAAIPDGFCDAICGNCSYVLPTDAIGGHVREVVGQGKQFQRREGEGRLLVKYVRTPKTEQEVGPVLPEYDADTGRPPRFRDPFTHCVDPRAAIVQQALSRDETLFTWDGFWNGRVLTGRFGHNSNADAESEFRAFEICRRAPAETSAIVEVCGVCGTRRKAPDGGEEQWPCLDHTNTAHSKWERFDGQMNVDDSTLGNLGQDRQNPLPICRASGEPVFGM